MGINTVAPIADKPDFMRHEFLCRACGAVATFDVAKKAKTGAAS